MHYYSQNKKIKLIHQLINGYTTSAPLVERAACEALEYRKNFASWIVIFTISHGFLEPFVIKLIYQIDKCKYMNVTVPVACHTGIPGVCKQLYSISITVDAFTCKFSQ